MAALSATFNGLSLRSSATTSTSVRTPVAARFTTSKCGAGCKCCLSSRTSLQGTALSAAPRGVTLARSIGFQVVAKQNSLRRQRTAEKARLRNKAKKSKIFTLTKKTGLEIDAMVSNDVKSEEDFATAEKYLSETFKAIDKAVQTGVLHQNTAARKKSILSRKKRDALVKLGLYTPAV